MRAHPDNQFQFRLPHDLADELRRYASERGVRHPNIAAKMLVAQGLHSPWAARYEQMLKEQPGRTRFSDYVRSDRGANRSS